MIISQPNQGAAAPNRRPAEQSDGSGNLSATLAADRAFPAAVAELLGLFKDGVLKMHLPKNPEAKPMSIEVKVG